MQFFGYPAMAIDPDNPDDQGPDVSTPVPFTIEVRRGKRVVEVLRGNVGKDQRESERYKHTY